jgi:hypothetical protein
MRQERPCRPRCLGLAALNRAAMKYVCLLMLGCRHWGIGTRRASSTLRSTYMLLRLNPDLHRWRRSCRWPLDRHALSCSLQGPRRTMQCSCRHHALSGTYGTLALSRDVVRFVCRWQARVCRQQPCRCSTRRGLEGVLHAQTAAVLAMKGPTAIADVSPTCRRSGAA